MNEVYRKCSTKSAALNHGLFLAPRGIIALSTVISDALVDEIIERASAAFADVAADAQ